MDGDRNDGAACERRAIAYLEAGEPAAALPWAERAAVLLPDGGPHNVVGMAHAGLGDHAAALVAYTRAVALAPDRPAPHYNCAAMAEALGDHAAARAHIRRALALDPHDRDALMLLARVLIDAGDDVPGALEDCLLALQADAPDDASLRHLLDAARGQVTAAPPRGYVVDTFDSAADDYDAMMIERLGYRGHTLIAGAVAATGVDRFERALDLGCGSGLVGAAVRPWVGWLGGVDLSARMLDHADRRAVYDRLDLADVVEHLRDDAAPLDLVVAADLLIYLGNVAPLFAAIRARLATGGRWIFTVEDAGAAPVTLLRSGRYAHGRDHLAHALAAADLTARSTEPCVLRTHLGAPVAGLVVVAARA